MKPRKPAPLKKSEPRALAQYVRPRAIGISRAEPAVLLCFEDVTESRERELRLARTESALRDAERRKDDFLAALSHELRHPLAPIRNSLFVLSHANASGEHSKK